MCDHANCECLCQVTRLYEHEGRVLVGYTLDVRIVCRDCQMPFHFLGLPGGLHTSSPTVSFDGTEARLPIAPGPLFPDEGEASREHTID